MEAKEIKPKPSSQNSVQTGTSKTKKTTKRTNEFKEPAKQAGKHHLTAQTTMATAISAKQGTKSQLAPSDLEYDLEHDPNRFEDHDFFYNQDASDCIHRLDVEGNQLHATLMDKAEKIVFRTKKTETEPGNHPRMLVGDQKQNKFVLFNVSAHHAKGALYEFTPPFQYLTPSLIDSDPLLSKILHVCFVIQIAPSDGGELIQGEVDANDAPTSVVTGADGKSKSKKSGLTDILQRENKKYEYALFFQIQGAVITSSVKNETDKDGKVTGTKCIYETTFVDKVPLDEFTEALLAVMGIDPSLTGSNDNIKRSLVLSTKTRSFREAFNPITQRFFVARDKQHEMLVQTIIDKVSPLAFFATIPGADKASKLFTSMFDSNCNRLLEGFTEGFEKYECIQMLNKHKKANKFKKDVFPYMRFQEFAEVVYDITIQILETALPTLSKPLQAAVPVLLALKRDVLPHKKLFVSNYIRAHEEVRQKYLHAVYADAMDRYEPAHPSFSATLSVTSMADYLKKKGCVDLFHYDSSTWFYLLFGAKWLQQVVLPQHGSVSNTHTTLCLYGAPGTGKSKMLLIFESMMKSFMWAQKKSFQNADIVDAQLLVISEAAITSEQLVEDPIFKEITDFEARTKIDIKGMPMIYATKYLPVMITSNKDIASIFENIQDQNHKNAYYRRAVLIPFIGEPFKTVHRMFPNMKKYYELANPRKERNTALFNTLIALAQLLPDGGRPIHRQDDFRDYYESCITQFLQTSFGKFYVRHQQHLNGLVEKCYLQSTVHNTKRTAEMLRLIYKKAIELVEQIWDDETATLLSRKDVSSEQGIQYMMNATRLRLPKYILRQMFTEFSSAYAMPVPNGILPKILNESSYRQLFYQNPGRQEEIKEAEEAKGAECLIQLTQDGKIAQVSMPTLPNESEMAKALKCGSGDNENEDNPYLIKLNDYIKVLREQGNQEDMLHINLLTNEQIQITPPQMAQPSGYSYPQSYMQNISHAHFHHYNQADSIYGAPPFNESASLVGRPKSDSLGVKRKHSSQLPLLGSRMEQLSVNMQEFSNAAGYEAGLTGRVHFSKPITPFATGSLAQTYEVFGETEYNVGEDQTAPMVSKKRTAKAGTKKSTPQSQTKQSQSKLVTAPAQHVATRSSKKQQ